jgi:L-cysteine/cystine lyase
MRIPENSRQAGCRARRRQNARMSSAPERSFAEARAAFPVLEHLAYLNAGTFGPLSAATVAAMQSATARDLHEGRSGLPFYTETTEARERLRSRLGALVGAEDGTVALASSTTEACNIVLAGLGLEPEDEIVTTTDEHFGLLGALGCSPARVVVTAPDPDRILAAVTSRTKLIAVSHVLWTTGAILPVHELRAASAVPLLVDGAQSVGAIPVDVRGVDFYTVSGQKWLCGPDSTGALVVTDPDRLRVTAPSYYSQTAYRPDGTFDPQPTAQRFEQGWWAAARIRGLDVAIDGRPTWAFDRAREIAERLRDRLRGRFEVVTPAERATLVSFAADDPPALVGRLHEAGVRVRDIPGRDLVRVSVGYWTSDGDLDRLLGAL